MVPVRHKHLQEAVVALSNDYIPSNLVCSLVAEIVYPPLLISEKRVTLELNMVDVKRVEHC